jgi:NAD+ kinase
VIARERHQRMNGLLDHVRKAAKSRRMEVRFEQAIADYAEDGRALDLQSEPVDMILSLGGDGTLLRAARTVIGHGIPLLGVNLGDLGFLTSAGEDELDASLDRLAQGEYFLDLRSTLKASVLDESGTELDVYLALNDFVVHKAEVAARVTRLDLYVEGGARREEIGSFTGDGVILASPTGSTAYSLSAGGPIVHPHMECLVVTPICSHTLAVRPLVVPATRKVTVQAADPDQDLVLTVDGQEVRRLGAGDAVRVEKGDQQVQLVRFPGQSFFSTLRRKLNWAVRSGDGTF